MATNFGKGFGSGLLGMFGLSFAYDPFKDLNAELSKATSTLEETFQKGTLMAFSYQQKATQELFDLLLNEKNYTMQVINKNRLIASENVTTLKTTIYVFIALIFIILIFVILQKKCC